MVCCRSSEHFIQEIPNLNILKIPSTGNCGIHQGSQRFGHFDTSYVGTDNIYCNTSHTYLITHTLI